MKYIHKIILENFQSHIYSEIEFGPDLNVIVGPSDSGKSAIIRALKWVMYNEPSGDFFIREGEKECRVTVELSEGTKLQRYRTKSKNGYRLIDNNGFESVFEGIGLTVPQEIIDITGITKIQLDSDSENAINLGEQLEGPFLLTEKASTRANAIGRLVGVDLVDDALRDVLRDIRSLNQNRKQKEETLDETSKRIEEFDYIEQIKKTYAQVNSIIGKAKQLDEKVNTLQGIRKSIDSLNVEITRVEGVIDRLKNIDKLRKTLDQLNSNVRNYNIYLSIYNLMEVNTLSKAKTQLILDNLSEFEKAYTLESAIESSILLYDRLRLNSNQISNINKEILYLDKVNIGLDKLEFTSDLIESVHIKHRFLKDLDYLSKKYTSVNNSLIRGKAYIMKLNPALANENMIKQLNNKVKMLTEVHKLNSKIDTILREISKTELLIEENNKNLNDILREYKKLLHKIEKCPICLGDIDEVTIEHIMTHHLGG
ncbi:AAA family ATPase [Gudongella sp. DL1XJH-153]|uniref:AAA family ATPase n=1 Tax=Gudongella sp. DL1XJH-153 TaxID=3409804 RepID=UPI003BB4A152